MKYKFHFTFDNIKAQYIKVIDSGYKIITCKEYLEYKHSSFSKLLVNRVDIDCSVKKAEKLGLIYNELGIKASFFVRLHAPEYNPFSFENYRIIKFLIDSGHEIGYHSEVIDQSVIWHEDAEECLIRDIYILNKMFNINVCGVASHGGMTGLNNLDFWKDKKASDDGLLYEAYEESENFNLFQESFYISDSEWTQWKCYNKGKLVNGDNRSLSEHVMDHHNLIYFLIHSDTYFDRHFYE